MSGMAARTSSSISPILAARSVETVKRWMAVCTSSSVAMSERRIRATDSEMRTIASSWRTVIGTARGARPRRSISASSSTSPCRSCT